MHLYLDTTEKLIIGLLDENYQWVDYFEEDIRSASSRIQGIIFDNLLRYSKKIKDIQTVFQTSGPGSYTGMRVSEGLCQILEWHDIPIYSFYHFEVPQFYGHTEGTWAANAYKGDLFVYSWNGSNEDYKLMKESQADCIDQKNLFSHFLKSPFELLDDDNLTSMMIKQQPQVIFEKVKSDKLRREPYYYRPLEVEFTKPTKNK